MPLFAHPKGSFGAAGVTGNAPTSETSMGKVKKSNIVHVINNLIPVIQGKRDKHPNTKENPRIQINDTAAWQLVQLQLVPLAPEQEVHPARKEEINKSLQRIL